MEMKNFLDLFISNRAKKICSANYFKKEIQLIKRYAAWNGYT